MKGAGLVSKPSMLALRVTHLWVLELLKITSPSTSVASRNIDCDKPKDADTPELSWPSSRSVADSDTEGDEDDVLVPSSKKKTGDDTPVTRVRWKKGKCTVATQFLLAMVDMQDRLQERQMQHDAMT